MLITCGWCHHYKVKLNELIKLEILMEVVTEKL
jgi:hypothetical protein